MNKCTNTNIWIDHDFIISFVIVLSHFAHSSAQHSSSTPVGNNKALPQIVHVNYCKEQISIHGVKSLPPDVHQLVSLFHNSSHYVVLTIDIPGGIFKIYDGISRDLLQWMNYIVLVLKKCMLLDHVSYDSSKTIVMADEATLPAVSHSRRPGKSINGYSITFPWCQPSDMIFQPRQLETGYFIYQKNGFNCGPIACLKFRNKLTSDKGKRLCFWVHKQLARSLFHEAGILPGSSI